jgi:hypothetical protein
VISALSISLSSAIERILQGETLKSFLRRLAAAVLTIQGPS